ncbi:integrase [Escherichia coli]|uniref:Integrase n=1 Tax=Escherichia coli TaxID=562 RepID=A0A376KQ00_ECOLX|nr:integrase [Escherichia coli]
MEVNARGVKYAERLLGEIKNQIIDGTFEYAKYFPKLPKAGVVRGSEKKTKI